MAELENTTGWCLSPEQRQRDWLDWRNSRIAESRPGRSSEIPSLLFRHPHNLTSLDENDGDNINNSS